MFLIATPVQSASASFQLVQGERIYVDRDGGVGSGTLAVTDPQGGVLVASALHEEDTQFEAVEGGRYFLTLQPNDDFNGTAPISLVSIADNTHINVSIGQTFSLTLNTLG